MDQRSLIDTQKMEGNRSSGFNRNLKSIYSKKLYPCCCPCAISINVIPLPARYGTLFILKIKPSKNDGPVLLQHYAWHLIWGTERQKSTL